MVVLAASAATVATVQSGFNYVRLEADNLEGYISLYGQYSKQREGFNHVAEKDMYVCKQGKVLLNKGIKSDGGYFNYHYRSSVTDCKDCLHGPAQLNKHVAVKALAKR